MHTRAHKHAQTKNQQIKNTTKNKQTRFKSSRPEVEYAAAKAAGKSVAAAMVPREEPRPRGDTEAVVKIRGLPFGASDDDIKEFFADLPIADRGTKCTVPHYTYLHMLRHYSLSLPSPRTHKSTAR